MNNVFYGAWLYYVLIVAIGGFFIVNLFLAILLQEFLDKSQVPWRAPRLRSSHAFYPALSESPDRKQSRQRRRLPKETSS